MKPVILSIVVAIGVLALVGLIILIASARRLNSYERNLSLLILLIYEILI